METTLAPAALIERYLACWNEPDPERRRQLITETFTADATYRDPLLQGTGHEGIDAMIAGFQAQYPGFTFARSDDPDSDRTFGWYVTDPAGVTQLHGTDAYTLGNDGRFASITGTFDAGTV